MRRTALYAAALLAFCVSTALCAQAASYRCKTTCGYGPYRCLTKERERVYILNFAPGNRTVTVQGGEAPGTFDISKSASYWRWSTRGGVHRVSYAYREQVRDLKVEISYTTIAPNGGTVFDTNYYTGFCSPA